MHRCGLRCGHVSYRANLTQAARFDFCPVGFPRHKEDTRLRSRFRRMSAFWKLLWKRNLAAPGRQAPRPASRPYDAACRSHDASSSDTLRRSAISSSLMSGRSSIRFLAVRCNVAHRESMNRALWPASWPSRKRVSYLLKSSGQIPNCWISRASSSDISRMTNTSLIRSSCATSQCLPQGAQRRYDSHQSDLRASATLSSFGKTNSSSSTGAKSTTRTRASSSQRQSSGLAVDPFPTVGELLEVAARPVVSGPRSGGLIRRGGRTAPDWQCNKAKG